MWNICLKKRSEEKSGRKSKTHPNSTMPKLGLRKNSSVQLWSEGQVSYYDQDSWWKLSGENDDMFAVQNHRSYHWEAKGSARIRSDTDYGNGAVLTENGTNNWKWSILPSVNMGSKGEHQKISQSITLFSSGAHFSFLCRGGRYKFLFKSFIQKPNRHIEVALLTWT